MAQLVFNIKDQWIRREDSFKPVARSKNYLYAKFKFLSEEWDGTVTALFADSQNTYTVLIEANGECLVPWEVLSGEDKNFTVSVFCGNLVTANKVKVRLYESGYTDDAESETPPTPSVYNQIIERMDDVEQTVVDSAEAAAGSASSASASAGAAAGSAVQAAESASAAGTSAQAAASAASSAGQKATAAAGSASEASSKASAAAESATAAAGSASTASTKASEAAQSALEAGTSKTDAESAKNAAVQAKTGAEAARDAAQQAIAHGPIITDGYWYLWDQNTNQYVNSGVKAEIEVDDELDEQSENPVQNKVIDAEIGDLKADINNKIDKPQTAGTSGQVLTSDGQGGQTWETPADCDVTDVQVNGTSVVNQGVANVPLANTTDTYGVVRIGSGLTTTSGSLVPNKASDTQVKEGTQIYRPIVPSVQHSAAFYGLAKAASDTTQSQSSNPVGTYTDAAKIAIQKMLGLNQQGELIADVTATEDVTEFYITTDLNGLPFELKKMIVIFSAGPSTTGARDSFYTWFNATLWDDTNGIITSSSWMYPTATSTMFSKIEANINDGMPFTYSSVVSTASASTGAIQAMPRNEVLKAFTGFRVYQTAAGKSLIPSGSNIKIYGIRA